VRRACLKLKQIISNRGILAAALLTIVFLLAFFGTIHGLVDVWSTDDDYSYGFLMPFVIVYLIWERRKEISQTAASTNWLGGVFFLLFLIFGVYGVLGSNPSAARIAVPFLIITMTLFCLGKATMKIIIFPLIFLFFMIPLPTTLQVAVGVPLKLISTQLGGVILYVAGVPAFIEGNVIDLGVTQLQVVDACAGLRFIFPLLALGLLFAYFFETIRWKQAVLVLITIPISVLTNGIRIGATGILAQRYGSQVAEGFFHGFSGWIVFMFAFFLLFAFHFLFLRKIFKKSKAGTVDVASGQQHISDKNSTNAADRFSLIPVLICAVCLIVVAITTHITSTLPPVSIRGGMSAFPQNFGAWEGRPESMDTEMIKLSGAEDVVNALYQTTDRKPISLYIGYRGSPFTESENFFHSPNVCLPSSGWKTISATKHKIEKVPRFGSIIVSKMLIEKAGEKQLVYYWFQTKNRTSHDVNINRFHLTLHALRRDNTYDLFIRPIAPISPGESIERAQQRMDGFVREMMGTLLQFMKEMQYEEG
jgi:exosortase D (VPLPA-CTERM-specific)